MNRGTQVVYYPPHVQEQGWNINHPDVEFGFVTSVKDIDAYVRYWHKGHLPKGATDIDNCLRTKSNSERTPLDALVERDTVPQDVVDVALDLIYSETAF